MNSTNLKKGDSVVILSGKDRGKNGKILEVDRKTGKIIVEGVNIHHRFERSKRAGTAGTRIEFAAHMPAGKVMLVCPNCGKSSRVGHSFLENGSKQRICKKCGKTI